MGTLWPPLFYIIGIIASTTSSPYYTVLAPKVARINSDYHVAIITTETSEPSDIYVELSAEMDSGDTYNVSQTTVVEPYTTRIIKFEIGDTPYRNYKLVAQGLSGIKFHRTAFLQYGHKSHSVFIQTDRSVYKPGSKVLFRVVVLDSRLRPAQNGTGLDIYVTDGEENRVKKWKQQMNDKGVFSGELQLSDEPVLGDWKIFVNVLDQTIEKTFQVEEYVLPKFEVSIEVPKIVTLKDSVITAIIRAKYTYGKSVKGEATITASTEVSSGYHRSMFPSSVRRVVPIDGKAVVNFDLSRELSLVDDYNGPIKVEVIVNEELTGRSQNSSIDIKVHKYKYTMELIKTAENYKPGLKYTTFIKIAHHDGSPVQDQTNPVEIRYVFTHYGSVYTTITRMLDKHGMIQLDFYPLLDPNNTVEQLHIEAKYLNLEEWFNPIYRAFSPSMTYIQAVLNTENPMVSKDVEIEVNSTVPLKYISYEVLGRGDILVADSVQIAEKNTASFRFLATNAMAPTAHIIVHYMREDGEIVADALDVHLNGTLQNFVDIVTGQQEAKPGEGVDLIITSKPNSYVGLLGVDQSSVLLKSGNDISHEQVMKELRSYDADDGFSSDDSPWDSLYWSPGSSSAFDVFDKSSAIVLTNGLAYRKPQPLVLDNPIAYEEAYDDFPDPPSTTMNVQPVKVRKNFPETWLWQMLDTGPDGKTILKKSVPDTITSWVLTAFSVNSDHGFGLIEEPRKLTVFQPFFISLNLPYSVIRGEIVAISIIVFNYLDKDLTAEVVLENEGQYEFAEATNEVHETPKLEPRRKKTIEVKAASGTSVSFLIIPKKLGPIVIKATATSPLAGDSIEQPLLVKPEGETQYVNEAIFVDLRNSTAFETSVPVDIPEDAVPGSEHIEVSAVGDILGPTLPNLANLIKMPYGCGEQNMLNFVPNIVVINYLKNTYQLTEAVHGKALKFLDVGYQRELTYRHDDGSFSAFGKSDKSGSTWLTAFVAKSFIQAAEHITVEDRIIEEALQWLASIQSPEGNFPEIGVVSYQAMQGGAGKGLALTAFTLIAFLENPDYVLEYNNIITKGVDYIIRNLDGLDDVYSLCLCAYVLNLAKHPNEEAAFERMLAKAEQTKDHLWWSKPVPKNDDNPWYSKPSSVNVEMTSYAMLTYLKRNMVADSLPIMKWLVSQRNADGGFASTQDTVIGIYALSKLGEKLSSETTHVDILFKYEDGGQSNINVNPENNIILQKLVIPGKAREVNISATGDGFAIIQVSHSYNLNTTGAWPLFTLNPQIGENSDANHLHLSICSGFIPTEEASESNMAVIEVSFPSGFALDPDSLPSLKASEHVKRVETKNGDTVAVLYFDKMAKEEYCVNVSAFRTHKIAKQKPVPVTVYDYYDSSRRATVFYEPMAATLCDICEAEDCGNACQTGNAAEETVLDVEPATNTTSR